MQHNILPLVAVRLPFILFEVWLLLLLLSISIVARCCRVRVAIVLRAVVVALVRHDLARHKSGGGRCLRRPRLAPRFGSDLIAVESRCTSIILVHHRQRIVPVVLGVEKAARLAIAAHLHLLQLRVLPLVHGDRPHEAQMHAEAPMLARALQAYPNAIGHRGPLRVEGVALETRLQRERERARKNKTKLANTGPKRNEPRIRYVVIIFRLQVRENTSRAGAGHFESLVIKFATANYLDAT